MAPNRKEAAEEMAGRLRDCQAMIRNDGWCRRTQSVERRSAITEQKIAAAARRRQRAGPFAAQRRGGSAHLNKIREIHDSLTYFRLRKK